MTAIECYNQSLAAAKLQALEVLLKRALSDDPRESRLAAAQILRAAPLKSAPERHPASAQPENALPPARRQPAPTPPAPASVRPAAPSPEPPRVAPAQIQARKPVILPPLEEPLSRPPVPPHVPGPAGRLSAVAGSCSPLSPAPVRLLSPPRRNGP